MFLPGYWSKKLEYLRLTTEKKWKYFTLFYEKTQLNMMMPKVNVASCGFLSTFKECFVPLYHRGVCDNNLWLVTGKAVYKLF